MKKQTKSLEIVDKIANGLTLTPQQEKTLRANMPSWIPEKENTGTSMLQTAQEFLIMLEELLQRFHGFTEKEIIKLEKEVKVTLPVLHTMEKGHLSILTDRDMFPIGEIAELRQQRLENSEKDIFLTPSKNAIKVLELARSIGRTREYLLDQKRIKQLRKGKK